MGRLSGFIRSATRSSQPPRIHAPAGVDPRGGALRRGSGVLKRKSPPCHPGLGAAGQWAGAVRIVRSRGRGRPAPRWPPITGAGLDPPCAPAGIPSNGSDGEGCWGGETAGTDADVGGVVARVSAVPEGGAGVVRIVDPRAPAQQLNDPPSPSPQPEARPRETGFGLRRDGRRGAWREPGGGGGMRGVKNFEGAFGAFPKQPTNQQPRVKNSRSAKG